MYHKRKVFISIFFSLIFITLSFPVYTTSASTSSSISFVILSKYKAAADIGSEFHIVAFTSTGKFPTWKSSNSSIASVNTYGKVTAKKAGTVTITAKIKNAEASCKVTVNKTRITINKESSSLEHGEMLKLSATTSNNSEVKWKSSKSSVATVDEYGKVVGVKPGETTITAAADGSSASCKIHVKVPVVNLNKTDVKLYRNQKTRLTATVSSGITPIWKTNRRSVAVVDDQGYVTAVKNGIAVISATVDGVTKNCRVVVQKPDITLSISEMTLKKGASASITSSVSSGNLPVWSSSNSEVATVNSSGIINALKKGTAYIYASEDGTKVRCIVHVTD